ncbi:hypothetical protein BDR07DRAFT_1465150 [Suillus spraguei]|nr:hypothetical protein BDR07DRAFT_1465150 [Suillus spraguei]
MLPGLGLCTLKLDHDESRTQASSIPEGAQSFLDDAGLRIRNALRIIEHSEAWWDSRRGLRGEYATDDTEHSCSEGSSSAKCQISDGQVLEGMQRLSNARVRAAAAKPDVQLGHSNAIGSVLDLQYNTIKQGDQQNLSGTDKNDEKANLISNLAGVKSSCQRRVDWSEVKIASQATKQP